MTAAAVAGSLVGSRLVSHVPADALRRTFGWFVLAMGALVGVQQVPDELSVPALLAMAGIGVVMAICSAFVPRCPLRHTGGRAT